MSSVSFNCTKCKTTNRILLSDIEDAASCKKCNSELLDGVVIELLMHNFQALINSKKPLLVFMSGPNCSICKTFTPIFNTFAAQKNAKVRFAQAYLPKNKGLTNKYKIRGVPTVALFAKGKLQAIVHGGMRNNELAQFVKKNVV
ncbi:MAG: thioredoxin domain-containing protein [Oceanospirillaceae bacterium]